MKLSDRLTTASLPSVTTKDSLMECPLTVMNVALLFLGQCFCAKRDLVKMAIKLDGLNETELVRYQKRFEKPEVLVNWGGHYMALPRLYSAKI